MGADEGGGISDQKGPGAPGGIPENVWWRI